MDKKTHKDYQYDSLKAAARIVENALKDVSLDDLTGLAFYAPLASMLHTAFEVGLKGLLDEECKTHDLYEIYGNLSRDVQVRLDEAFRDVVDFYDIEPLTSLHRHYANLSTYLEETGRKSHFELYRYWALDKLAEDDRVSRRHKRIYPDPGVNSHMVCFIAEMIASDEPFLLSQEVEYRILDTMNKYMSSIFTATPDQWEVRVKPELDNLKRWVTRAGSFSLAMEYAVKYKFDLDELGSDSNRLLADTYDDLKEQDHDTERRAFEHLFRKWEFGQIKNLI